MEHKMINERMQQLAGISLNEGLKFEIKDYHTKKKFTKKQLLDKYKQLEKKYKTNKSGFITDWDNAGEFGGFPLWTVAVHELYKKEYNKWGEVLIPVYDDLRKAFGNMKGFEKGQELSLGTDNGFNYGFDF
jgi:hypothetical protein